MCFTKGIKLFSIIILFWFDNETGELFKSNNILVLGVEGQDTSDWILIDCEDLVINIMNNETRVYYDLETLWGYEDAALNSNLWN